MNGARKVFGVRVSRPNIEAKALAKSNLLVARQRSVARCKPQRINTTEQKQTKHHAGSGCDADSVGRRHLN